MSCFGPQRMSKSRRCWHQRHCESGILIFSGRVGLCGVVNGCVGGVGWGDALFLSVAFRLCWTLLPEFRTVLCRMHAVTQSSEMGFCADSIKSLGNIHCFGSRWLCCTFTAFRRSCSLIQLDFAGITWTRVLRFMRRQSLRCVWEKRIFLCLWNTSIRLWIGMDGIMLLNFVLNFVFSYCSISSSEKVITSHILLLLDFFTWSSCTRFVAMVEAGYNECIYHNGLHAADVTHALHCLLDCQVSASSSKFGKALVLTGNLPSRTHGEISHRKNFFLAFWRQEFTIWDTRVILCLERSA